MHTSPRRDDGFTLIEMLAVMVIVGLLSAIAVPQIGAFRERAHITSMKSDLRNAAAVVEGELADTGTVPTSIEGLFAASPNTTVTVVRAAGTEAPAAFNVNAALRPDGAGGIQMEFDCPNVWVNSGGTAYCAKPDGESFSITGTGAHAVTECRRANGDTYTNTVNPFIGDSVRGSVAENPGKWTTGQPGTFVVNTAPTFGKCAWPTDTLVGVKYAGQNSATGTVRFNIAWGTLAPPPEGDDYCLEARNTKTNKTFSWKSDKGLVKAAC